MFASPSAKRAVCSVRSVGAPAKGSHFEQCGQAVFAHARGPDANGQPVRRYFPAGAGMDAAEAASAQHFRAKCARMDITRKQMLRREGTCGAVRAAHTCHTLDVRVLLEAVTRAVCAMTPMASVRVLSEEYMCILGWTSLFSSMYVRTKL